MEIRKIPAVMFSQHPDHAGIPYWHNHPFIETHHELEECYLMFKDLGAEEMMWDWEGKLVDEAVVERLLTKYFDFFQNKPLGKELFLTFRVPNPRIESGYRLGRAFMIILSSHHIAHTANLTHPPLFEVILPMTESAQELIALQESFQKISHAATDSFGSNSFSTEDIEVIPIFESVETILRSGTIVREYIDTAKKKGLRSLQYLRPFCARSDPALNAGIVPTTLAIKWALADYERVTKETGIHMYPIIAPGALPFRGGLTPATTDAFLNEFPGLKTIVIQSSFRYDYPLEQVKKAISTITKKLQTTKAQSVDPTLLPDLENVIAMFANPYKAFIPTIAPLIAPVAAAIPSRRERVQHTGLFGYSRQVGEVSLPRAIGFTGSCYSLGIPSELFGTGKGLAAAIKEGKLELVESLYKNLKPALTFAGRFLRKESIQQLHLTSLAKDVESIEDYLGQRLGPKSEADEQHCRLAGEIIELVNGGHNPQTQIEQAAILRHSLG